MGADEQPGQSRGQQGRRRAFVVFRSWHGDAAFWQAVYGNALAGLAVVAVVYFVAVLAGVVTRRPAVVVSVAVLAGGTVTMLAALATARRCWPEFRSAFEFQPGEEPTPQELQAERARNRLLWGFWFVLLGTLLLGASLVGPSTVS